MVRPLTDAADTAGPIGAGSSCNPGRQQPSPPVSFGRRRPNWKPAAPGVGSIAPVMVPIVKSAMKPMTLLAPGAAFGVVLAG